MQENLLILAGYLGGKPELRYLPSGTPVANVRMAQSYEFKKDNRTEEHTNWFNLVFYGNLADVAMKFQKGENIHVSARLEQRQWEAKTGTKRTVYEVVVHKCHRVANLSEGSEIPDKKEPLPSNSDAVNGQDSQHVHESDDEWVI
jgi:single-strand DNA-binding protein